MTNRPGVGLLLSLLAGCGGARAVPEASQPSALHARTCSLALPQDYRHVLARELGASAELDEQVRPLAIDMTADGRPELALFARAGERRWLVVLGCRGAEPVLLGRHGPEPEAQTTLAAISALRPPDHELRVTYASGERQLQVFWGWNGHELRYLLQANTRYVAQGRQAPTTADVLFRDTDADGVNDRAIVVEHPRTTVPGSEGNVPSDEPPTLQYHVFDSASFQFEAAPLPEREPAILGSTR